MSRTRTRTIAADEACAAAVEPARRAAEDIARPGEVGEHLGFEGEGERVVTHYFACLDRAYQGWRWAITVTRASRARNVTVSETVLLPGVGALLAPSWVPWSQRLRPGDLGVGDLLPAEADDDRLAPGFTETGDDEDHQMLFEYGLGRARVLSAIGRDLAVRRWHSGESGPSAPLAQAAPAQCSTCGFYWPLAGALRLGFGVCANEYAPDDGRVVAADHGCGAHSEATTAPPMVVDQVPPILDDLGYDTLPADDDPVPAAPSALETAPAEAAAREVHASAAPDLPDVGDALPEAGDAAPEAGADHAPGDAADAEPADEPIAAAEPTAEPTAEPAAEAAAPAESAGRDAAAGLDVADADTEFHAPAESAEPHAGDAGVDGDAAAGSTESSAEAGDSSPGAESADEAGEA